MYSCCIVAVLAAAPPKFGMCGGHINALGLWFTRKHTRTRPYIHVHTQVTLTHILWDVFGITEIGRSASGQLTDTALLFVIPNKTFDLIISS
jgi:hypothetical protein